MCQRHIPSIPPTIHCDGHSGCLLVGAHDAGKTGQLSKRRAPLIALPLPSLPLLLKYWERLGLRAHSTSSPASTFSAEFCPIMSSLGGSDTGGEGVPEKRGPGRPRGSGKKTDMSVTTPPASRKRGRPKGSHNQKTLAALAAAAAAASSTAAAAGRLWLLVAGALRRNKGPAAQRGAGGRPRRRQRLLLHLPGAVDGHRAAIIRKLLLPSGPLPLAPRGPMRRLLLWLVHLGFNRCFRRSNRRPTPRPRGGPPS
jgi:hypothetical protein